MDALDSEASTSSYKMPKSTSDGQLLLHSTAPSTSNSNSSHGSTTPPLPAGQSRKMKPFILRGKSPVLAQGQFDVGSPPSSSSIELDRMSLVSGSSGGKTLTRTKSMDRANPINRRASVALTQAPPLPPTRHRSKPSRATSRSENIFPPEQRLPRQRKPRPQSVAVSASELRNAQTVEALKIKRQKEAALGRRYSQFEINIHPGIAHLSEGSISEQTEEPSSHRVARRESSLGDLTNSQRSRSTSASAIDKENSLEMSSRPSSVTPKKALRRIASATASPLRTPTRQALAPSKAKSYSNLNSNKQTPVKVHVEKTEAESPVHFTSMEQLLQEQGYSHTRVFTPPQPLRHHTSSAALLQQALNPTAPPSPPMLTTLSPTAASPALLGAELHPSAQSLRPKSSMLSLRGLLSLWSSSGAPVNEDAVAHIPGEDEQFGPLNPIDFNEGGSDLGSDDTTVERRLVRASAWVHLQAGHSDDEFGPSFGELPKPSRSKFGSADAERSMAYSSFGIAATELGLQPDEDRIASLAREDGQSVAAAYAAGYREAMEQQKHQRPQALRTTSHLVADQTTKRRSLRHVVSESALALAPPSQSSRPQSPPELIGHASGYQSFGFASAGLTFNLDFEEDAQVNMDGEGGRTGSVRYEYEGSSNGSDSGDARLTLPVPSRGMLAKPMSSVWSGVSTLKNRASTLFFGPQVPAIEVDSAAETEDEDRKPQLLKKASTAALKLAPVVSTGAEFGDFDWGMDGLTGSRK